MASNSAIEWTDATWNPTTGCTKVSPGCTHCYAERLSYRLKAMGRANYANGFQITTHQSSLELPLKWKRPRHIFVNSMSDLFHEGIPDEFILAVFDTMTRASGHQFQVLTKRSERLRVLDPLLPWSPNIWMGVSVESADYGYRLDHLRQTRAAVKFVSFEPLIGPVENVRLTGLNWVIVGGESGPGARPMEKAWVMDVLTKCQSAGTPFFFKQWGGPVRKKAGREIDGRTWNQMPLPKA